MARVYSQVLLHHVPGDGATQTVTVPETVLWVIRDIVVVWDGESDAGTEFYNLSVVSDTGLILYGQPGSSGAHLVEHWQGRQVVDAGDGIEWAGTTDTWYSRVCGYALDLP